MPSQGPQAAGEAIWDLPAENANGAPYLPLAAARRARAASTATVAAATLRQFFLRLHARSWQRSGTGHSRDTRESLASAAISFSNLMKHDLSESSRCLRTPGGLDCWLIGSTSQGLLHAPSVPGGRVVARPGVRRVRGRLVGNPGPAPNRPGRPRAGLPGNPVGLPETLLGSRGCLAAPAWRRFVTRCDALASRPAPVARMQPFTP